MREFFREFPALESEKEYLRSQVPAAERGEVCRSFDTKKRYIDAIEAFRLHIDANSTTQECKDVVLNFFRSEEWFLLSCSSTTTVRNHVVVNVVNGFWRKCADCA